jgi:para-nitrobenzyl esterase
MACGTDPITVTTPDGPLEGETDGDVKLFRGIPYARPPVGDLRFAPPEPVEPWQETLAANAFKPACSQLSIDGKEFNTSSSEDCLYLNVWAPEGDGPFPVMFWIPGGGYIIGSGAQSEFDGQHLAEQREVVVVTINYRLAAFGFLGHPALREIEGTTGNFGLLDQREALRWVQRNIASFGGDPQNVTVFGESAGGGSTAMHLISPGSEGLFHRAILESAPATCFPMPTREESEAQARELSDALGCEGSASDMVQCLRAASMLDVLEALPPNDHFVFGEGVGWWPVVDGEVIPAQPVDLFASGTSSDIPIIIGANSDEARALFPKPGTVQGEDDARSILAEFLPAEQIDQVLGFYSLGSDPQEVMIQIMTDMFICDSRRVARLHTMAGGTAYQYHFTFGFYDDVIGGGAFHTAEIPFVFGNALGVPIPPAGIPLKNAVQGYWSSFARTGSPNGAEGPSWPRYDTDEDVSIRLDLKVSKLTGVRREQCDFWDTLRLPQP